MEPKRNMDTAGASALILIALLLAFNQVVVKVVNDGIQPVFAAGIRSVGGAICMYLWMRFRGNRLQWLPGTLKWGLAIGAIFSIEFIGLFNALDLSTVTRTSIIFYSMPLWLALVGHFAFPGERIHKTKALGLAIAFAGVAWAILDRGAGIEGEASLLGDACALLGALGWGSVAVLVRLSPLKNLRADMQNFWQLAVSAPILLVLAPLFGPLIRDLQPIHLAGLGYQIVIVVGFSFLFWMWLLTVYRAADVASFSFLAPIFGILLGWFLLGEEVGFSIIGAGTLVALGLLLINRPAPQAAKSRKTSV